MDRRHVTGIINCWLDRNMYSKNPIPAPHKETELWDCSALYALKIKNDSGFNICLFFVSFLEDVLYTVADPSPLVSILQRIHHRETV